MFIACLDILIQEVRALKIVLQRVNSASVQVDNKEISGIKQGLLVFLGVEKEDKLEDAQYLVEKIINLRIFEDPEYKMNLSLQDIQGELLVVSQFTLLADCRKGRRPSFDNAAKPQLAEQLYNSFIELCREKQIKTLAGQFQAEMLVDIKNHGPVTILLDSKKNY